MSSKVPIDSPRFLPVFVFIAALTVSIAQQIDPFFLLSPKQVCRMTYGPNPFPESIEIAKYIQAHTTPQDRIAVMGSEAQIYFYAHRRSATGYTFTYALMEEQPAALRMQKEMISEIEAASPKYLVVVNVNASWLMRPKSYPLILQWIEKYAKANYKVVGVADIISADRTEYRWDEEAGSYAARARWYITVWQRRNQLAL